MSSQGVFDTQGIHKKLNLKTQATIQEDIDELDDLGGIVSDDDAEFDQPIQPLSQKSVDKLKQKLDEDLEWDGMPDFTQESDDDDFGITVQKTQGARIVDSSSEDDSEDEAEFERQLLARRAQAQDNTENIFYKSAIHWI